MASPINPPEVAGTPEFTDLSVAILAGGQSSRMGQDKALLRLTATGPTLLQRVVQSTRPFTTDLFIVSRLGTDYPDQQVAVHGDHYPETGVLGAICTALEAAAHDRVLVVSCDMPFLSRDALRWMASIHDSCDALVPVVAAKTRQGGEVTYQTLHAIYARACIPAIQQQLALGNRKVISFFPQIAVCDLPASAFARFDPALSTFLSVNTPEALQLATQIEQGDRSGMVDIT